MHGEKLNIFTKNIACINYTQFLMFWAWPLCFQNLMTKLVIYLVTKALETVSHELQLKNILRKSKEK